MITACCGGLFAGVLVGLAYYFGQKRGYRRGMFNQWVFTEVYQEAAWRAMWEGTGEPDGFEGLDPNLFDEVDNG